MSRLFLVTPLIGLALAGCEYNAPIDGPPISNVISGTVVFGGEGPPATAIVAAFAASNPPPPTGLGQPLFTDTVGADQYTSGSSGLKSGEFSLTRIPDGDYLITALMDVDGNFSPFTSVTAGATCGDWQGLHTTDLGAGIPAVVSVEGGDWVQDVTTVFGLLATLERPVFEVVTPAFSVGAVLQGQAPPFFRIRTNEVNTAFSEDMPLRLGPACEPAATCTPGIPACSCEPASIAECGTALYVKMNDADLDGVVDPYPGEIQASNGLLDIWPRVFLEYAGADLGTFDYNGKQVPERWLAEGFPMAGEIFAGAGAAGLPPGQVAAGFGPVGPPFPVNELSVTLNPVFRHVWAGGTQGEDEGGPFDYVAPTPTDPAGVPTGTWSVTVISFTGQLWSVPNEIAGFGLPALDPTVNQDGQGFGLEVTE